MNNFTPVVLDQTVTDYSDICFEGVSGVGRFDIWC